MRETDNLTDLFIDSIFRLTKQSFSDSVVHSFKRCLIDYLGATVAGAKLNNKQTDEYLNLVGDKTTDLQIFGRDKKSNIYNSIYLNGINSHIAELDDGVISGIIHPGAPIFSALLPVAEKENVSESQIVKAGIVAYEASVRLAEAIQPAHKAMGYHATGTCGTIGAAIAIAVALDFTKSEMKEAFSAAALSSYGTLKVLEDNSELKPFNVAKASVNGFIAAYNAKSGVRGPNDVLSGKKGWLSMMTDKYDPSLLLELRNNKFAIERTYFKPYASCRYTHPSIDAALSLREKVDAKDIASVDIKTYYWAVHNHDHTDIDSVSSAKMSIPFSFALAFINGSADINEFSDVNVNDIQISELTSKVKVSSEEKYTDLFPLKSVAEINVELSSGELLSEYIEFAKGEPANPISDKEMSDKFFSLALFCGSNKEAINLVLNKLWNISITCNATFSLNIEL